MTTKFENRIIREGIVDTRKYRYVCNDYSDRREIKRLPIEDLDTTAAIDGWETVKVVRAKEV